MKKISTLLTLTVAVILSLAACGGGETKGSFTIVDGAGSRQIYISDSAPRPIQIAVEYLCDDIEAISGIRPEVTNDPSKAKSGAIVIGLHNDPTVSPYIDSKELASGSERFQIKSFQGTDSPTVVIGGSDPRGAAYGIFELSKKMGVSPLYWWCDVAPKQSKTISLPKIDTISKEPSVRYRGIFINDEEAMIKWSEYTSKDKSQGAISPESYKRVFELMLRLGANTIWPSMMEAGSYFFEFCDPKTGEAINPRNATDYGIYIGTSHCENMARNNYCEWYDWARANKEKYNINDRLEWDYTINPVAIEAYWMERLEQSKNFNMIYTMGIRGVHDSPYQCRKLPNPTLANRVKFLQHIIDRQREMIAEVFGSEDAVPQIFVPYEETGELYNGESKDGKEQCEGLKLPEDIMIVTTEDNHGYLRQTPTPAELARKGGNGFYYHLAYQGGPSPYDWLTTMNYSLMREQLLKGYDAGAKDYWIVNVGDIKPTELGLSYFMAMAKDIESWRGREPREFVVEQSQALFGVDASTAKDITALYTEFTQTASAHRPDFMSSFQSVDFLGYNPEALYYSIFDYGDEAQHIIERYAAMEQRAKSINDRLTAEQQKPFWHLVYYPIRSAHNMAEKVYYYHKNHFYAAQGRLGAVNKYKQLSLEAAKRIKDDIEIYEAMEDGKWLGITDPYGYYNLTERVYDIAGIPEHLNYVTRYAEEAKQGIGSVAEGQKTSKERVTLRISRAEDNRKFIDIFNLDTQPTNWKISSDAEWVKFDQSTGALYEEHRVWVSANWDKAPQGVAKATITVTDGAGSEISYNIEAENFNVSLKERSYLEGSGYVAIEAERYSRATDGADGAKWIEYKDYGQSGSSMFVKGGSQSKVESKGAQLEYDIYFTSTGTFQGYIFRIPTLNEGKGKSCELAVSLDNGAETALEGIRHKGQRITQQLSNGAWDRRLWGRNTFTQIEKIPFVIEVKEAGYHTLKISQRDSEIGFDKITIATKPEGVTAIQRSIYGAPESYNSFAGGYAKRKYADIPKLRGVDVESYPTFEPLIYTKFCFSKYGCPEVWGFNVISNWNVYDPNQNQWGWSAESVKNVKVKHHESMRHVPHWKRDSNCGKAPATFCVNLKQGQYELTLYAGDYFNEFAQRKGVDYKMSITANGKVLEKDVVIKADNALMKCYEVKVGADNLLQVEFSGDWSVSAMEIYSK